MLSRHEVFPGTIVAHISRLKLLLPGTDKLFVVIGTACYVKTRRMAVVYHPLYEKKNCENMLYV